MNIDYHSTTDTCPFGEPNWPLPHHYPGYAPAPYIPPPPPLGHWEWVPHYPYYVSPQWVPPTIV